MKLTFWLAVAACIGLGIGASPAWPQDAAPEAHLVWPSYTDTDIFYIAGGVSAATGKSILVEARARKVVTWQAERPIPRDQLYSEFVRMLSRNGLAIREEGRSIRVTVAPETSK